MPHHPVPCSPPIPPPHPSHPPVRKVASRAAYFLQCLLTEHPRMKAVVVREVERFLFRRNLQDRARYYAVVFLSQMVLEREKEKEGEVRGGGTTCLSFCM